MLIVSDKKFSCGKPCICNKQGELSSAAYSWPYNWHQVNTFHSSIHLIQVMAKRRIMQSIYQRSLALRGHRIVWEEQRTRAESSIHHVIVSDLPGNLPLQWKHEHPSIHYQWLKQYEDWRPLIIVLYTVYYLLLLHDLFTTEMPDKTNLLTTIGTWLHIIWRNLCTISIPSLAEEQWFDLLTRSSSRME